MSRQFQFCLDLLGPRADIVIELGVVDRPREIEEAPFELSPFAVVQRLAGVFADTLPRASSEILVAERLPTKSQDCVARRKHAIQHEVVKRGEQLAAGEVAGASENDKRTGSCHMIPSCIGGEHLSLFRPGHGFPPALCGSSRFADSVSSERIAQGREHFLCK